MTDTPIPDFFTKQHSRLIDLAKIARIAAWVVFVIYALWAVVIILNSLVPLMTGPQPAIGGFFWLNALTAQPMMTANILVNALAKLGTGAVYLVGLLGISMGLSMIVETSLNSAEESPEDHDE